MPTDTDTATTSSHTNLSDPQATSFDSDEDDDLDILTVALPLRPGSDLCSKILLQEPYIKNIIISSVVGYGITGEAYLCSFTEQADGRKADFIYLPLAHDLPPVIVETQQKVGQKFISRAIRYCLNVLDSTNSFPILVVFNIAGFSSRAFRDSLFTQQDDQPFYSLQSKAWAKEVRVYNSNSIEQHLESPMQPLVALSYFCSNQGKSIIALDKYMDPVLQSIYEVAFRALSVGKDKQMAKDTAITNFCDAMIRQFNKIARSNQDSSTTVKRQIDEYAEDGAHFADMFKRRHVSSEPRPVTPITMEANEAPSADLNYVDNYRREATGRFTWVDCYDEGVANGHFSRYSSHLTLKKAFHQQTL
ncbi:uncharacterized protein BYT42DRAFT_586884 [Radiomyces spectabilis]|uniref:uncharacterized protein n=1 Tax=Radiomyces spectabilis TaxID=64574 RepID=UPI00221F05AB|nr:uncharacterized protein BYT42DRAFT_586884 [Radiomyces spectabilis]KAI8367613.1 hypothetical protein BYT42DRAFT_586884 [Radiomyces spectabilis]